MDVSHPSLLSSSLSKPLTFASVLDDDLRSANDYSFRSLRYRESLFLLLAGLVFLTASSVPQLSLCLPQDSIKHARVECGGKVSG